MTVWISAYKLNNNIPTKVSDKMVYANSVDLDQTAPSGAVWSGSFLFAYAIKYFKKQLHKKQNLGQKSME